MLTTDLCRHLGIEHPIFSAGLGGGIAGPALVAAVSNAGGLGVLGALSLPAPYLLRQIRRVRELTTRPFGVNLVIPALHGDEIDVCLAERIPILVLFWGDPSPFVAKAHDRGVTVLLQVGSVAEARRAADAGVDAVIVQGVEAGGHVRGTTSLLALLPAAVSAITPLPAIAAGGIADGRGLVAALSLGAQAVSMGTRFLASDEAQVTRSYKERVIRATAEDTVYTELFDIGWPDAPHRVLRNKAVDEWERAGRPAAGSRPGEGDVIGRATVGDVEVPALRHSVIPPVASFEGDEEYAALYAGESCSLVHDVKPAAAIVRDVMREAEEIVRGR